MILRAPGPEPVAILPVPPSAAVEAWYEAELLHGVHLMNDDIQQAVLHVYRRASQPILPLTFPYGELETALEKVEARWERTFAHAALDVAFRFVQMGLEHYDRAFVHSLAQGGIKVTPGSHTVASDGPVVLDSALAQDKAPEWVWSDLKVKLRMTDRLKQTVKDRLKENVDLISTKRVGGGPSIPAKAFAHVRKVVKESVEKGRDVAGLTKELHDSFGITARRAATIARDQNNKMTSAFQRTRQLDCGIAKARWIHTAASLQPREEHEEWDGAVYDVDVGMYSEVDGENVWPGTPINCGCLCESIIPGYNE